MLPRDTRMRVGATVPNSGGNCLTVQHTIRETLDMHILRQLSFLLSGISTAPKPAPGFNHALGVPGDLPYAPQPIVIWHGLGDNYNTTSMNRIKELIRTNIPQSFVYSVYIDEDPSVDEQKSIFGDANQELQIACDQLLQVPELQNGFTGIGFSQGGLFMRALIEKCPSVSVSKLVTFGSPHMGVLELPLCEKDGDWLCKKRNALLKRQVWLPLVQNRVIPAQYFRDPAQYPAYLEHSHFLAEINNEKPDSTDAEAKHRFSQLEKLVLIQFTQDTTLVPKESAFFQEVNPNTREIVPFDQTALFKNDLIGLRELYEENKINFYKVDDEHMRFLDDFFVNILQSLLG